MVALFLSPLTDDLISLIFAPLLKDRYLSRFTLTPQGGVLSIPEVGLSLVVPEGALPAEAEVLLGVSYNPADTPTVSRHHTLTCPTVVCATRPARLHFRRPVALAFAHSGGGPVLSKTKMTPRILQSHTDMGHATWWEEFPSSEREEDEEEVGCVTGDHCLVFLTSLRLFSLVVEQGSTGGHGGAKVANKNVRMVAFISYSPGRDCLALNVYCTDSLPSERQVSRSEQIYLFSWPMIMCHQLTMISKEIQ